MKIQIISKWQTQVKTNHDYICTTLGAPRTFDEFDINVISLQNDDLWKNNSFETTLIDDINDFKSISVSIQNSKKSNIIILLPQNYIFNRGPYSSKLKDMIDSLHKILAYLLPKETAFELIYENSKTNCCEEIFDAEFYFQNKKEYKVLTKNIGAEHPTTIEASPKLIYTTLELCDSTKSLDAFIKAVGLDNEKSNAPEWIKDIDFYDDKTQKLIVQAADEEISKLQDKIKEAERIIEKNLFYKSILYENGDNLVCPVAEMLERFTDVSLAGFVDEKKEDFKLSLGDVTFIGEIKGITSNVKNEHISQLDVHCQSYLDKLQESETIENVKGLLIINPFRNKPLSEREEVHENQIKLAQRNNSLIVTTEVFLLLFSSYLSHLITREEVIELLKSKTGILKFSDFIKEENKQELNNDQL